MATKFVPGKGLKFSISVDGGTTYTVVSQVKTTQFSGQKSDTEDITNMDSVGAFREFAPTLLDSGQLAITGVFDPSDPGQLSFNAAFIAQTLVACKLVYPPAAGQTVGYTRTFSGWVTENDLDAQFDKASTYSATIKITGPITAVAGS